MIGNLLPKHVELKTHFPHAIKVLLRSLHPSIPLRYALRQKIRGEGPITTLPWEPIQLALFYQLSSPARS